MATPTDTAETRRQALDAEALDRITVLLMEVSDPVAGIELDGIAKVVRATGRPTPQFGGPPHGATTPSRNRPDRGELMLSLDEANAVGRAIGMFMAVLEALPIEDPTLEDSQVHLEAVHNRLFPLVRRLLELEAPGLPAPF